MLDLTPLVLSILSAQAALVLVSPAQERLPSSSTPGFNSRFYDIQACGHFTSPGLAVSPSVRHIEEGEETPSKALCRALHGTGVLMNYNLSCSEHRKQGTC
jgi:hypothetical protein